MFVPKLFSTLKGYDRRTFLGDLTGGVVVGIVALPLSIAFAIASGVTPDRGLFTAIVAGFLISLLGGSRVQIGGPTGAFVVIIYGIVQRYGLGGLTVATLMGGLMLIAFGLAKLGSAIRYVPRPLVTGFTAGIAVIIAVGQLKDALGLRMGDVPAEFVEKVAAYAQHAGSVSVAAVALTLATVVVSALWGRVSHRIPGPLVALVATTAAAHLLALDVETIGSRFGTISASLPHFAMPDLSLVQVTQLVGPAFTIAFLGGIESLLSAVVADGMIGGKHRSNMELVAQGVANVAAPLFGGIPATGAIARTATNVKNGGRTPVAGIMHALTVLLATLFFGKWAALIPMATLAGILLLVAYGMSEWRVFRAELRSPRSDVAVLLVTFFLTVFVDLTVAIGVGMVLAAFLFMRRMAGITNITAITGEMREDDGAEELIDSVTRDFAVPDRVEVYEINGPFFFGAAAMFQDTLNQVATKPKVLILRMRKVPVIDATGLHALTDVVHRSRRDGVLVLLSGVQEQPMAAIRRSPVLEEIGEENLCPTFEAAVARAREELALQDLLHRAGAPGG